MSPPESFSLKFIYYFCCISYSLKVYPGQRKCPQTHRQTSHSLLLTRIIRIPKQFLVKFYNNLKKRQHDIIVNRMYSRAFASLRHHNCIQTIIKRGNNVLVAIILLILFLLFVFNLNCLFFVQKLYISLHSDADFSLYVVAKLKAED